MHNLGDGREVLGLLMLNLGDGRKVFPIGGLIERISAKAGVANSEIARKLYLWRGEEVRNTMAESNLGMATSWR